MCIRDSFTHFGLSGPLVLTASTLIREGESFSLSIDCKPALTPQQLDARLLRDFSEFSNRDFSNALDKLLPKKLIPIVVELSGIPPAAKVHSLTKEQRKRLVKLVKGIPLTVQGLRLSLIHICWPSLPRKSGRTTSSAGCCTRLAISSAGGFT